jgi:hypothetical protein
MDNAKARAWVESITPFYNIPDKIRDQVIVTVKSMILGVSNFANALQTAINKTNRPGLKAKREFWMRTETKFFELVEQRIQILISLIDQIEAIPEDKEIMQDWHKYLCTNTINLFLEYVECSQFEFEVFDKQIKAKNELRTKLYSKKNKEIFKLEGTNT